MSLTTFLKSNFFSKIINDPLYQSFFIKAIINYNEFIIEQNNKNNLYSIKIQKYKITSDYRFFNWKFYAILGGAIDYSIRIEIFKKLNPLQTDLSEFMQKTISQKSINILERYYQSNNIEDIPKIIDDYQNIIKNLNSDRSSPLYLSSLLKLSYLDSYYRQEFKDFDIKRYFIFNNQKYLEKILLDNMNILHELYISKIKEEDLVIYNPDFAFFSQLFSGADADIIINEKLIDFKSTTKNIVDFIDLWQISFYAYFYIISNEMKNNRIFLKEISLYFTQYDLNLNLDVEKLAPIFNIINKVCNILIKEKK